MASADLLPELGIGYDKQGVDFLRSIFMGNHGPQSSLVPGCGSKPMPFKLYAFWSVLSCCEPCAEGMQLSVVSYFYLESE